MGFEILDRNPGIARREMLAQLFETVGNLGLRGNHGPTFLKNSRKTAEVVTPDEPGSHDHGTTGHLIFKRGL